MEKDYEWLKTQKYGWVQGGIMFPVMVEIVSVDFEYKSVRVKTEYQSGTVPFERIFKSQSDCPCR